LIVICFYRQKRVVLYNLLNLTNWVGEPSIVMFRKSAIGSGFASTFYHFGDIEYWFRILGDNDYFYLNQTLASFRRHPESTTSRNLRGLYFAYDMLQISKKYKHVLEEFGEAEDFFYRRVAERAALNIAWMGRAGDYSCEDMLAATIDYVDSSQTRRELLEAKTLAFVSLQYLTATLAKLNDLECSSADKINNLTREIQKLKSSTTWKATAPARRIVKLFKK